MDIIIFPRATGKTTILIKMVKNDKNGCLLVRNEVLRDQIKQEYKIDVESWSGIGCENLKNSLCGKPRKTYYIDNAEILLEDLLYGLPIKTISMNIGSFNTTEVW